MKRVSVIIPVLDEELRITRALREVLNLPDVHELIVVDGGSRDRTVALVAAFDAVTLIHAPRGRAAQMNAGAAVASGELLVFLHADVRLPSDAVRWVREALAEPGVVAGAFRTWTVPDGAAPRWAPLLHLADLRSRYSRLPYGDQALFVRAEPFRAAGGFPLLPLMEDLELSRQLSKLGRIRTVPAAVLVSGRRFLARPLFYTLLVNVFPLLHRLGVPARWLGALYRQVR